MASFTAALAQRNEHINSVTVYCGVCVFVQTMNILIVNQSVIDLCASFFTLLTASIEVDGTGRSPDSFYDRFVCCIWLTRTPLWASLFTSTYNILLMTLERYAAVIYPVWYSNNVRTLQLFKKTWL